MLRGPEHLLRGRRQSTGLAAIRLRARSRKEQTAQLVSQETLSEQGFSIVYFLLCSAAVRFVLWILNSAVEDVEFLTLKTEVPY